MSGIYIQRMEMPEEGTYEAVFYIGPNGKAEIAVSPGEGEVGYWKEYQVISVPSHGRLIDADAARDEIDRVRPGRCYEDAWALTVMDNAPTIITAEDGEI